MSLEKAEQEKLREIIGKRNSKAEIVKRAYVLLSLDEKGEGAQESDEEIRRDYQVGQRTIERMRKRFVEEGVEVTLRGKPQTKFRDKKISGKATMIYTRRASRWPEKGKSLCAKAMIA